MPKAVDEALIALDTLRERVGSLGLPSVRIGVTGLSRAGKTVFITALVDALTGTGRFPLFEAKRSGRLASARIVPQPDDDVPRFEAERHREALVHDRSWPDSTRSISQLRVVLDYESETAWLGRRRQLAVDIVDYPGEWLLDLPLLDKDFATFSREAIELAELPGRAALALDWLEFARALDISGPPDEAAIAELHARFTAYLRACRVDGRALSTLPPGRFLMPGDLEGSPALTFGPMPGVTRGMGRDTLGGVLERRYEAYKTHVARPFFRDHFARLDRQVVLVDALQALNAGPDAVADIGRALTDVMASFRPGRTNVLTRLVARRVDRLLIAATKADHVHHTDHDRLQAIVSRLVADASERAGSKGADIRTAAIAAVRATREATRGEGDDALPLIVGTPIAGETIDGRTFDGETEIAIFPGDLPSDPRRAVEENQTGSIRFVRFRPPRIEAKHGGLPHIRFDRALDYLLGDRLA